MWYYVCFLTFFLVNYYTNPTHLCPIIYHRHYRIVYIKSASLNKRVETGGPKNIKIKSHYFEKIEVLNEYEQIKRI